MSSFKRKMQRQIQKNNGTLLHKKVVARKMGCKSVEEYNRRMARREKNFITSVYAKLGKLHAEYPELSSGEFKELSLTTQGYAYARVKDGEAIVAVMNNGDTPVQMEFQLHVEASGYEDLMEDTVGGQKLLAEVGWGRMKVQVPSNYATLLRLKH